MKNAVALLIVFAVGCGLSSADVSSCYQCASQNEDDCSSEPSKSMVTPCPVSPIDGEGKAVGCRKVVQVVGQMDQSEEETVVRECAFSGDVVDKYQRLGHKGITVAYSQCDKNDCNSATSVRHLGLTSVPVALLVVFLVL